MMRATPDIVVLEEFAKRDISLKWYAIADSAQHPCLPDALVRDSQPARCLFGASQESPVAKQAPHLIELSAPSVGGDVWSWISLNAKSKPCVTIIATALRFDDLFRRLAARVEVLLSDAFAMFFSFWDPAILGTLMGQGDDTTLHVKGPVLDCDQRSLLTDGLAAWWYWDRNGIFHSLQFDRASNSNWAVPIMLTQRQVDDLVEASVPDHVLYYIELNQPLLIVDVPVRKRYGRVREALLRARGIGLLAMGDLVNFVCIELIYKERFLNDAAILNLLDQVRQCTLTFDDFLEQLP